MQRYAGEPLPLNPKIALMANDALGNFAIATPLAQALRHHHVGAQIDFYGGERTAELEKASVGTLFQWRTSVHGTPFSEALRTGLARRDEIGGYDLVVNIEAGIANKALAAAIGDGGFVCGPSLAPNSRGDWEYPADARGDLWRDQKWSAEDIRDRFPFLRTSFIGEFFVRLAYLDAVPGAPWPGGIPRYLLPSAEPPIEPPPVLISTGATLSSKLWPVSKWRATLVDVRHKGFEIGLVGAPPKRQAEFYHSSNEQVLIDENLAIDMRGKLTLPEVVGALAKSKLVITVDNGILHFAAANDVPTVGLYRREIVRLWAPPNPNLRALVPTSGDVSQIAIADVLDSILGFL